jgi:DNA-binding protein Fis
MRQSKKPSKSSLGRAKDPVDQYELILIVCEGTKTEPFYYENMKAVERLPSANVVVTGDCGSDPLSVVKDGIRRYEKSLAEQNPSNLYDIVFCVIDRDDHQTFNAAIQVASQYNNTHNKAIIIPIKSYPSFEVWYLFHFIYTRSSFVKTHAKSSGQRCKETLNVEWKKVFNEDYEKSKTDIYEKLKSKNLIDQGIVHAERALEDSKQINEPNPSTEASLLLKFLLNVRSQGYGIKSILDNIYELSHEIEENLLKIHDHDEKYLELLESYSLRIETEIQNIVASLRKKNVEINKIRLRFIKSYLEQLKIRIDIAKDELIHELCS